MIHKVNMTHSVTLFIKHEDMDKLEDYINSHTPYEAYKEAVRAGGYPEENFNDEILCEVDSNSEPDLVL